MNNLHIKSESNITAPGYDGIILVAHSVEDLTNDLSPIKSTLLEHLKLGK